MFSIRKVKTGSGATAVQVVIYKGKKAEVIKHIGSARTDDELKVLLGHASQYISNQSGHNSLFPEASPSILFVERARHIGTGHHFAHSFFLACAKACGLDGLPSLLLDLAIMRLIEPASKLRSFELLDKYFGIEYSLRSYRKIPLLLQKKQAIEALAFHCAIETLGEDCYLVLYDVTTLYFETHRKDELRIPGFSKDDKSKQPQIMVGLLVTPTGFPLSHEVFPGNTFEGKTMLPLLKAFISAHHKRPVVVADAAMLSEENMELLKENGIFYIVGARIANTSKSFIEKISNTLAQNPKAIVRFPAKHGDMVCSFSSERYRKQQREMQEQLDKAQKLIASQTLGKRTKFVKQLEKSKVALNEELISKTKLLLGIKGYCTNIPETLLPNAQVIERYHDLWRVEQSFRMSKSDLQSRPIYHRKEEAIRAHVLICFVSLMLEKYLELSTRLSLRTIRDMVWAITETHIEDTLTKEVFVFRSSLEEVMRSPLANLIKKWGLPH